MDKETTKNKRGGKREGAGRPASAIPRRMIRMPDHWFMIYKTRGPEQFWKMIEIGYNYYIEEEELLSNT